VSQFLWLALAAVLSSCGGLPASQGTSASVAETNAAPRRSANAPDDCAAQPGQPPPEPLHKEYTGLARKARCQREVYTIMGGVTHFLGVECKHCHVEPDYTLMTHNKQVANWMARELVPRLQKRDGGGEVWCNDCHQGKPKNLGDPRKPGFAIEWMTTHLVERFDTSLGKPLLCRNCHQGDVGSPEFQRKIILTQNLPQGRSLPNTAPRAVAAEAEAVEPPPLPTTPQPAESAPPLPDYGGR
jgi:hypothetical protein